MTMLRLTTAVVLAGSLLAWAGCSKQERADLTDKAKGAYQDSVASLERTWDKVKTYSYEKRDEFRANANAVSSSMDAKIREMRASYSESKASASRQAAMKELKNSEADYKAKLDALSRATADTWESAKQNVIAAWERLEASYHKARAD